MTRQIRIYLILAGCLYGTLVSGVDFRTMSGSAKAELQGYNQADSTTSGNHYFSDTDSGYNRAGLKDCLWGTPCPYTGNRPFPTIQQIKAIFKEADNGN